MPGCCRTRHWLKTEGRIWDYQCSINSHAGGNQGNRSADFIGRCIHNLEAEAGPSRNRKEYRPTHKRKRRIISFAAVLPVLWSSSSSHCAKRRILTKDFIAQFSGELRGSDRNALNYCDSAKIMGVSYFIENVYNVVVLRGQRGQDCQMLNYFERLNRLTQGVGKRLICRHKPTLMEESLFFSFFFLLLPHLFFCLSFFLFFFFFSLPSFLSFFRSVNA